MMKNFCNKADDVERFAMANCAMILNRAESRLSVTGHQIFKCKTCHRSFKTFQALGGHTASHKRPKLVGGEYSVSEKQLMKAHKCSICKHEFWTGQALGGHMRKHRTPKICFLDQINDNIINFNSNNNNNSGSSSSDDHSQDLKMINCEDKRILGLDLNLSPEENEFKCLEF